MEIEGDLIKILILLLLEQGPWGWDYTEAGAWLEQVGRLQSPGPVAWPLHRPLHPTRAGWIRSLSILAMVKCCAFCTVILALSSPQLLICDLKTHFTEQT